ncbi:MAG: polyprenol monophosphomannose synthase [Candidatus Bathyarchaeota archaeon]|jgi:dolichol-phosphate mannosyltransferase
MNLQASCSSKISHVPTHKLSDDSRSDRDISRLIEGDLSIKSEIGIILPTYCEAQNIGNLINDVENLDLDTCILVIDDSSPDNTANIVRALQREHPNILLYVRSEKRGLGTAITDAFKLFMMLENPPNCIITMDADYSHDPREIPKLVEPVRNGCKLAVGSRYCKGGGTRDWSIIRLIISKIANFMAALIIGANVHDYTSGLRCYSSDLVRNIINDLHSTTYEIQIETIRQARLRKFKIREVPITFLNRKRGKSKLSLNEVKQFLSYIIFRQFS